MKKNEFDEIAKKELKFLETDYGFNLIMSEKNEFDYTLKYTNKTTGIKIIYEFREAYIFIFLYRLIDGKMIENPRKITNDTILNCYSLDDVVMFRNPSSLVSPAYKYGIDSKYHDKEKGLSLYVFEFVKNLINHAKDILVGDFGIFNEIDKIIKKRAMDLK